MIIETERLIIRPFVESDYKRIYEVCNDFEVAKTTLSLPIPYTEEDAKSFITYTLNSAKENNYHEYGICFKDDPNNIIGCIGLCSISSRSLKAELGYWIDRNHWKKGIASEAAKAIINFAFKELKLHSVFARHFDMNPASGKVMQKIGMTYVGKMREHEQRLGKYYDVIYYETIASDYDK